MMTSNRIKTVLALVAVVMTGFVSNVAARDMPAQLPDPDGKPADMSKPVKVFILLGQSNMLGFGAVGPEEWPRRSSPSAARRANTPNSRATSKPSMPVRSTVGGGSHYGGNAETYMEVGNALGRAMAELLQK